MRYSLSSADVKLESRRQVDANRVRDQSWLKDQAVHDELAAIREPVYCLLRYLHIAGPCPAKWDRS